MNLENRDAVRVLVRERVQQPVVNHAEDNSRSADPQRQRKNREQREPPILEEGSQTVAKILMELIDPIGSAHDKGDPPRRDPRRSDYRLRQTDFDADQTARGRRQSTSNGRFS